MAATRETTGDPATSSYLREVRLLVASGLWIGLLAGAAAGGLEILRNGYLDLGYDLSILKTLSGSIRRGLVAGILFMTVAGSILFLLKPVRSAALRMPAYFLILAALFVIGDGLDLEDSWWVAGWEVWTAAALSLLVALRPFWPALRPGLATFIPPAILAVTMIGADRVEASRAAALQGRPNILFLLVDALRPDHMGSYGYERETTPTMDRLAAEGVRFSRAVSPSNKTRTTMPSLWTGLYPSLHGVFTLHDRIPRGLTTAAERLRESGYRTAAFCPNPNLDRTVGHDQGWDRYDDRALRPERYEGPDWSRFETASKIHQRLLGWIDGAPERPFLAWLHYRDVHGPYVPPPPYDTMFRSEGLRRISNEEAALRNKYLNLEGDGDNLLHYLDQYDGEIRYVDDRLAELLQALGERGLRRRTILILTADHGEAFLDHGLWNHGTSLHEEQIHVPLIVAGPGIMHRLEERVVSALDVFPTILELAGLEIPDNDGLSLVPLLTSDDGGPRPPRVYCEGASPKGNRQWAVREGDWKLIVDDEAGTIELYDLAADPLEREDRLADRPEISERLLADLRAFIDRSGGGMPRRAEPGEIDPELRERLRSLGYVE